MHINFTRIEVPEGIKKDRVRVTDIKEGFADLVYNQGQGVACGALALKIYHSDDNTDYTPQEVDLIKRISSILATPAVNDGILAAIEKASAQPK